MIGLDLKELKSGWMALPLLLGLISYGMVFL